MTDITFADGSTAPAYMFLTNDALGMAHIGLAGVSMTEAMLIMADANKTAQMICGGSTAIGYTQIQLLSLERDGVRVQMGRSYE